MPSNILPSPHSTLHLPAYLPTCSTNPNIPTSFGSSSLLVPSHPHPSSHATLLSGLSFPTSSHTYHATLATPDPHPSQPPTPCIRISTTKYSNSTILNTNHMPSCLMVHCSHPPTALVSSTITLLLLYPLTPHVLSYSPKYTLAQPHCTLSPIYPKAATPNISTPTRALS